MYYAHINGGTVFKPQFFNFPNEINAIFEDPEKHIMIGDSILLPTTYERGSQEEQFFFGAGSWMNILKGGRKLSGKTFLPISTQFTE